jgi:hypothetical protein
MAWIQIVPPSQDERVRAAVEGQRALYPPEYDEFVPAADPYAQPDDETSGVVATHSLIPDALYHVFAAFGVLLSPDLPLSRRQHELIATMVSLANRCHY